MSTDATLIDNLAHLVRLDVTPEEAPKFNKQLPAIIHYVGQLADVDAPVVPAVRDEHASLRSDVVRQFGNRPAILDQAPARHGDFWKVKSVF